jgi:hypothetical protein
MILIGAAGWRSGRDDVSPKNIDHVSHAFTGEA